MMPIDPVVPFPLAAQQSPPDPEERARRLKVEVDRLAGLPTVERMLYLENEGLAEKHDISRAAMKAMVEATIKEREKKAREDKAEGDRTRRRAEKAAAAKKQKKERTFKTLDALPEAEQEKRLDELARELAEDPAAVRDEFADASPPPVESEPELWPEAVATAQLLDDLSKQIRRFVFIRPEELTAAVLFMAMCWIHNAVATYSPILTIKSADYGSGRTTFLDVLARCAPKPFRCGDLSAASAYRRIDREHPTLVIDEADGVFVGKKDLVTIINQSWTRNWPVARALPGQAGEHLYDVFCPKIIGLLSAKLPGMTASRCITVKIWPCLPEETIEDFPYVDGPEFIEIRSKAARWAADNAVALGETRPEQPDGFHNRLAANWRLLLAIADQAGGDWGKRARQAAMKLSRQRAEPSQGRRLLAALREIFANRDAIGSKEIVELLAADPTAEWCEYGRGRGPITQRQLAVALEPYEVFPVVLHPTKRADKSQHGYRAAQFKDAWARFSPSDPNNRTLKVK